MDMFRKTVNSMSKLSVNKTEDDGYHVLLFGETGSGKSTLINYLVNYGKNDLDNLVMAIPNKYYKSTGLYKSTEKSLENASSSKTNDCTIYDVHVDGVKFRFIDTPGLSDTEGTKKDDENVMKILRVAEETKKLAAVVIVINGTVARATVNLRNTLARMRGCIPDAILSNLILVLTNCTETSYNFELKTLKPWIVPVQNVFCTNNSALSRDPKSWRNNARARSEVEMQWNDSMEIVGALLQRVTEFGQTATGDFTTMREKRNEIKAELAGILLEVRKLQDTQDQLDNYQAMGKQLDENVDKFSNFTQVKTVNYIEMMDVDYYSTICMNHPEKICHERCGLNETSEPGNNIFMSCYCFSSSEGVACKECACGHMTHYHARKKPVSKTKTVEEVLEDVKAQYDLHQGKRQDLSQNVLSLTEQMENLKKLLQVKEKMIKECFVKIKQICSGFNFVQELTAVIHTMETNAQTLTSIKARQEADRMIREIKTLVNHLSTHGDKKGGESSQHGDEEEVIFRRSTRNNTHAALGDEVKPANLPDSRELMPQVPDYRAYRELMEFQRTVGINLPMHGMSDPLRHQPPFVQGYNPRHSPNPGYHPTPNWTPVPYDQYGPHAAPMMRPRMVQQVRPQSSGVFGPPTGDHVQPKPTASSKYVSFRSSMPPPPPSVPPEIPFVSVNATVMTCNDASKQWAPLGSGGGSLQARLEILKNTSKGTWRLVAKRISDNEILVDCPVVNGYIYTVSSQDPTFHSWQTNRTLFGFQFVDASGAKAFSHEMSDVRKELMKNAADRSVKETGVFSAPEKPQKGKLDFWVSGFKTGISAEEIEKELRNRGVENINYVKLLNSPTPKPGQYSQSARISISKDEVARFKAALSEPHFRVASWKWKSEREDLVQS